MIRLQILSGKQAGSHVVARRFPFRVGRLKDSDLHSEESGVWDRHLTLELDPGGISAATSDGASLMVNDEPVRERLLRVGDVLSIGSLKLRFWMDDAGQKNGAVYQNLNLLFWLAVVGFQLWLIVKFLT